MCKNVVYSACIFPLPQVHTASLVRPRTSADCFYGLSPRTFPPQAASVFYSTLRGGVVSYKLKILTRAKSGVESVHLHLALPGWHTFCVPLDLEYSVPYAHSFTR